MKSDSRQCARRLKKGLHVVIWWLALPGLLWAQTSTSGLILGTVTEVSGAAVPGATVQLLSTSTNVNRTVQTNTSGQYTFADVAPGEYSVIVSAPGFAQSVLTVRVEVAKSVLLDALLKVGGISEKIEVHGSSVELQTVDASVGEVVTEDTMEHLPTIQRRVAELSYLQVGAQPILASGGYDRGGGVTGARPDQNVFSLDGIEITDPAEGGIAGQIGPGMPIPLDAVEEFRGTVTNPNASFGRSSGGQYSFTTRQGTNDFHGALYEYHQNKVLNANTWTRNFLGQPKPALIDNRFGVRVGGPIIKGKTFFSAFYEGRRFPQSTDVHRLVPTSSFRAGILRFRDASGNIVSYDLATSTMCGSASNKPCDPRGIGMSPVVSQLMTQYPIGNAPADGDGLNTIGFRGSTDSSQSDNFALVRVDHNLNQQWRINGAFVFSQEQITDPFQVEMDPALTGGKPFKTLAGLPNDGRVGYIAATGQFKPNLVADFRVGWTQTGSPLVRAAARTQVPAAGFPIELAPNLLGSPGDVDANFARPQYSRQHVWHGVANLSWLKGRHNVQSGATYEHLHYNHTRIDNVAFTTVPVAQLTSGISTSIPSSETPPTCGASTQSNCLLPSDVNRWDQLYAAVLGQVDNVTYAQTRNAQGQIQPIGSALRAIVNWQHLELFSMDTFRITPSLTLTYGLNFLFETPVSETHGNQTFLIDTSTGQHIAAHDFLAQRSAAAQKGETFTPQIGFVPTNGQNLYPPQHKFAPRLAAAWNPSFDSGLLGKLFGPRRTVLRGGYGLVYDRLNTVGPVVGPLLGDLIMTQTSSVRRPLNGAGQPYRVGVDGPVPIASAPPSIPIPFIPGPGAIFFGFGFDSKYTIAHMHSGNLTLQRSLGNDSVVELGWIGRYGRHLPNAVNLNSVPVFIKDMSGKSSQTFAQAFDAVANQLRAGSPVTPQPWFENNLGPGGTAQLAAADPSDFIGDGVGFLFPFFINPALKNPVLNPQFFAFYIASEAGWSNYNAAFVNIRKRTKFGLSMTLNYTWSHSMDTAGSVQDNFGGGMVTDPYNPGFDYGDSFTDHRHSFNMYGIYEFPWAKKSKWLGGWYTSGIFQAYTGQPLSVTQGGALYGLSLTPSESVPVLPNTNVSEGLNHNVAGSNGVGTAGDPARGGTGLNLFSNPAAVFNGLRPFQLSMDSRSQRGVFRTLPWWNLDYSVGKTTAITERVKLVISVDFFNLFNHPIFNPPNSMSILDPTQFGVITQQAGNHSQGDFAGPRRVQGGLRIKF